MARKKPVQKRLRGSARAGKRKPARAGRRKAAAARRPAGKRDPLLAPMKGATRREIGHVQLELARAGLARVKRTIYPPGFRWSVDMKPVVGSELCMHAHVGFLARGAIHIGYADGCVVEYEAPQVVAIDPGHDGWVVGDESAVLIEFDFEGDTVGRLGMPGVHRHP